MNFSKQLKKYREQHGLSQEVLAEKIYVTRQTISKWENDRSYPDIHNLVALSVLFDISLDELVKGDVGKMKRMIGNEEMEKNTKGMAIALALTLIIGVPSIVVGNWGFVPFGLLWLISMYFAMKLEKLKKKYNVKTYKEIVAFTEGKMDFDELSKQRDRKKYILEKVVIVLVFTTIFALLGFVLKCLTVFVMNL
ncbi:hypothetical protein IGI37_003184 [Enterococcus sp. AZ194]|uniref:helix-turn-helix domain-containing protein n=1 Tax=Enterococcus sp. AZ194 TaxID=2774629 RepID=UPI003F24EC89